MPKQYLRLLSQHSLLEETLLRTSRFIDKSSQFIVTIKDQEPTILDHLRDFPAGQLIFEPEARNTAPCILLGLLHLLANGAKKEDVVAIFPADHVILNVQGHEKTLKRAAQLAQEQGMIVTIGIPPHYPHTGYGYIHRGRALDGYETSYQVHSFKEKPSREVATTYLQTGEYFWNAGLFVATFECLLREFALQAPEFYRVVPLIQSLYETSKEGKVTADEFAQKLKLLYQLFPANSIDYAVMEKAENVLVTMADFDWNDLGSWEALEQVYDQDQEKVKRENIVIPQRIKTITDKAKGNIVYTEIDQEYVCLVNVEDLIILNTEKTLVVLPKTDSQKVKNLVEELKLRGELHLL